MFDPCSFRSALGPVIHRYLHLKQALGRLYTAEYYILRGLDSFLTETGSADLDADVFLRWSATQGHLASGVRRNRMRIVRNLCLYRRRTESSCYVPDTELFPANHQPTPPHIFTKPQIVRLLEETDRLYSVSHAPLRVPAIRMAVVLLYTTGVRLGELLRLELADYDATERVLHVRASKFHKSRYVPVSCDTAAEIGRYLQIRQQLRLPVASEKKLLWHGSAQGDGYGKGRLRFTMHTLFRLAETQTVRGTSPRIHDFRHTFAVHALLRWYEEGIDVQAKLPLLATYMGHVSIVSTQRYLHFIEPLASASSMRFATRCAALVETVASRRGGTR